MTENFIKSEKLPIDLPDKKIDNRNEMRSESILLKIPKAKLCEKCDKLKTNAIIKRDIGNEKHTVHSNCSAGELRKTESTDTLVAFPQNVCVQNNILTVSHRLSMDELEIESIESIDHAIPKIKQNSATSVNLNDRKSPEMEVSKQYEDDKIELNKNIREWRKKKPVMVVSLTDLGILEEQLVAKEDFSSMSIHFNSMKKERKQEGSQGPGKKILSTISKAFRPKPHQ